MPKFEKGSAEAKAWAEKMRKARDAKKMSGGSMVSPVPIISVDEVTTGKSKSKKKTLSGGWLQPGENPIQQLKEVAYTGLNLEDMLSKEDMDIIEGGKVNIGKELKKIEKKVSKATKPIVKATAPVVQPIASVANKIDKAVQPSMQKGTIAFSKGLEKVNPVTLAIQDPAIRDLMIKTGEISNDYILPSVVQAGMPLYYGAAGTAGMMLGGPLGAMAAVQGAKALHDEMVGKQGYSPAQNQKSKALGQFSSAVGKVGASRIKDDLKPVKEKPVKPVVSGEGICDCCKRCKMCGMGLYA